MDRQTLAHMKRYQIMGLALLLSALTGVGVYIALRRMGLGRSSRGPTVEEMTGQASEVPIQPAVNTVTSMQTPPHFSEDLLVPGLTHTGPEIVQQDTEVGRSSEGV